jgi:transcriptional regulator with XRE-family HTH domain
MPELKKFRENVKRYRKRGYTIEGRPYTQKDLAKAIGLSPNELGHRLNGNGRVSLSHENVLAIVLTLAEWKTVTWEEAVDLLSSMDYPLNQPHWKTELQRFLSAPFVSGLLPSVVEVSRQRGESKSISPAKEPVLSSTEPQPIRTSQPSAHSWKNREYAECRGWEYVTYETQRGLGNALMSRQLGPSDVEACPQLPEVATVLQHLTVTSSAIIKGKSGSGKTITAYQAAYAMYKQGWKVFRLAEPHHPADELIDGINHLPQRAVLLLDNAQSLDPGFVRHLLERSTDNLAVIVVSTDDVVHPLDSVSIASSRAVAILAQEFYTRKKEILPIIQKLNRRHIGEGFLDIPLVLQRDFLW